MSQYSAVRADDRQCVRPSESQQDPKASVSSIEMFRPDPNGHSAEEIIAKLSDVLADVPPDSLRAQKLAEMIRGLQKRTEDGSEAGREPRQVDEEAGR